MNTKLIQERHDRLVNEIGKVLKNNFLENKIQIERTWHSWTELVKPDITVIDEKESHCVIIEVTCPYGSNKEYLHQRKLEKEKKYCSLIAEELWQVKYNTGEVVGIVNRTMGTTLEDSHRAIKRLGLVNQCSAL